MQKKDTSNNKLNIICGALVLAFVGVTTYATIQNHVLGNEEYSFKNITPKSGGSIRP